MRVYIDYKSVDVDVTFDTQIAVTIEPGLWHVERDGQAWAVTSLVGTLQADGSIAFRYPKGVLRRPSGAYAARERILARDLRSPDEDWADIPAPVRDAIADAYLLAHDAIPSALKGTS